MVFVLDTHKKPLDPCTDKRAKQLLYARRAVIHRYAPFTIRLKDRNLTESVVHPLRVKLDPGSKKTGVALIDDQRGAVLMLGELHHKAGISDKLTSRRSLRRGRRNRKTRYRAPRFLNRGGDKTGWLPPSLTARVQQSVHLIAKLRRLAPITAISVEHVKFDTQILEKPDIGGVEYQQGTLFGYEVKEYLLERDQRQCAYCQKKDVPLEIDHIVPRSRGGSNRVSNLTLSCHPCNQKKSNQSAAEFGHPTVLQRTRRTLKDAAVMNATRWRLVAEVHRTGLSIECGSGGRTKYQRTQRQLPKTHYYDAVCVGASTPETVTFKTQRVVVFAYLGRGSRQIVQPDAYGFPRQYRLRKKSSAGFMTGDLVRGTQPKNKQDRVLQTPKSMVGRVTVRKSETKAVSFYFSLPGGKRFSFTPKHTRLLQRGDGWRYDHLRLEKASG